MIGAALRRTVASSCIVNQPSALVRRLSSMMFPPLDLEKALTSSHMIKSSLESPEALRKSCRQSVARAVNTPADSLTPIVGRDAFFCPIQYGCRGEMATGE